MKLYNSLFGITAQGDKVYRYTIENDNKMSVSIINYAGCIQSLLVPDKNGKQTDVVLGYDTLSEYENGNVFFGAFVGRYANRIGKAAFMLNGKLYCLPKNDGNNHLHGSFAHRVFDIVQKEDSVILHGISQDGEEGFPGTLTFEVAYKLTNDNALIISYSAESDKDTVINLTNHSYFNLNGQDGSTILDHSLKMTARAYTKSDEELIPTGEIIPADGTPMDFTSGKKIGRDISAPYEQLINANGYDHNFVLDVCNDVKEFAILSSDKTGITMHCCTDQPGVQFYSGNFLNNEKGKCRALYPFRGGLCLETQHYPDSPNKEDFPSTVLKAGEKYQSTTIYRFENT